jgi:DNA primase
MSWQRLVEQALPVIDYTFDMVTSKLDLTRAKDKSLAIDKLLPILAGMKDTVRQGYYLERLARLVNQSQGRVEAALSRIKPDRRAKETKPEAMARALRPLRSNPVEENCLALILQHPQLKAHCQGLLPEYFEDTQNREIFLAFKQVDDVSSVKKRLDGALYDYFDYLIGKNLLATHLEQRCADYALGLQEKFLRSLETKRQEVLVLAAESGGSTAELAKLQEQGIEISVQLGKVFAQKSQTRSGTGEVRNELGR